MPSVFFLAPAMWSYAHGKCANSPGRIYTLAEKCYRQVIDLMRLCLVFGLPPPCRSKAGEDNSDEPVPRTPGSGDGNNTAVTAWGGWLCTAGRAAKWRGRHSGRPTANSFP